MNHHNLDILSNAKSELIEVIENLKKLQTDGDDNFDTQVVKNDTKFYNWYYNEGQEFKEFSSFRFLEDYFDKTFTAYNNYFEERNAPLRKTFFSDGVAKRRAMLNNLFNKTLLASDKFLSSIDMFVENVERSKIIEKATADFPSEQSNDDILQKTEEVKTSSVVSPINIDVETVENTVESEITSQNSLSETIEEIKIEDSSLIQDTFVEKPTIGASSEIQIPNVSEEVDEVIEQTTSEDDIAFTRVDEVVKFEDIEKQSLLEETLPQETASLQDVSIIKENKEVVSEVQDDVVDIEDTSLNDEFLEKSDEIDEDTTKLEDVVKNSTEEVLENVQEELVEEKLDTEVTANIQEEALNVETPSENVIDEVLEQKEDVVKESLEEISSITESEELQKETEVSEVTDTIQKQDEITMNSDDFDDIKQKTTKKFNVTNIESPGKFDAPIDLSLFDDDFNLSNEVVADEQPKLETYTETIEEVQSSDTVSSGIVGASIADTELEQLRNKIKLGFEERLKSLQ